MLVLLDKISEDYPTYDILIFCVKRVGFVTLSKRSHSMENITTLSKETTQKEIYFVKQLVSFTLQSLFFYLLAGVNLLGFGQYYFCFGVYFALLWCHFNPYLLSVSYLLGCCLRSWSMMGCYIHCTTVIIGVILAVILLHGNRSINKYVMIVLSGLSQAMLIYLRWVSLVSGLTAVIGVVLGMVVTYLSITVFSATILRSYAKRLNLDEKVCCFVLGLILLLGIPSDGAIDWLLVVSSILLVGSTYFSSFTILITGVLVSLAGFGATGVGIYGIGLLCVTLCLMAFRLLAIYYRVISYLLAQVLVVFGLACYTPTILTWCMIGVVMLVIVCLPQKKVNHFVARYALADHGMVYRNMIARSKQSLKKRVGDIAMVFREMDRAYRKMVQGVIGIEEAKVMMNNETTSLLCKNCPNRGKCRRDRLMTQSMEEVISVGFEKGKVSLLDLPQYLSSNCNRVNALLSTVNQLLSSYKHYATMINNMDSSRLLIADTLSGIGDIMDHLSVEIEDNITYDTQKEEQIVADLSYYNIAVVEAIVYEQDVYVKNITLVVKKYDNTLKTKQLIEKVVSKVCGVKMRVVGMDAGQLPTTTTLHMTTAPTYDIVFGTATCTKAGVVSSGDTHSLIEVASGKYLVALCDGMGSGKEARSGSRLAIGLLENFYKAGFENEIILTSINKLLSLSGDEHFNALDVAVLDLKAGNMDFIKLGAPQGYLKRSNGTEIIGTSGLPLGVLEEMRPHITQKRIENFDQLIMVTDGVSDAFDTPDNLSQFINLQDTINPQTLADKILEKAVALQDGYPSDDMSVSVVRIYQVE